MITAKSHFEQPRLLLFLFVLILWPVLTMVPTSVCHTVGRDGSGHLTVIVHTWNPRLACSLFFRCPPQQESTFPDARPPQLTSLQLFPLFFVSHQRFSFHPGVIFYETAALSRLVFPLDQKQKTSKPKNPQIPFHSSLCPLPLPHSSSE